MTSRIDRSSFVQGFRHSSPYIHAHRGRTFVVTFGGEAIVSAEFSELVHDLALLHSLGIHLVLVHGARPQIEERLARAGARIRYVNGLRVTEDNALACVREAVGYVRTEIEAQLSLGIANSPMAGARIRVASGNFVTAQPVGVRDGVDYRHTGQVRRIDTSGIRTCLKCGAIVLLSPIGYSPTGEIFNLSAKEVAVATATLLQADKLIFLSEEPSLGSSDGSPISDLSPVQVEDLLEQRTDLPQETMGLLRFAVDACRRGVGRTHLVHRPIRGALLLELFTRDGAGTLVNADLYEKIRDAHIDDVGGIIELIAPLEAEGVLVRRSRERLETEIEHFVVVERDGTIIGCAALYPSSEAGFGELACMATHGEYQGEGRADNLLNYIEARARQLRIDRLFVLTTHTAHWFHERGFAPARIDELPMSRQTLYNYQRNSKVYIKRL